MNKLTRAGLSIVLLGLLFIGAGCVYRLFKQPDMHWQVALMYIIGIFTIGAGVLVIGDMLIHSPRKQEP